MVCISVVYACNNAAKKENSETTNVQMPDSSVSTIGDSIKLNKGAKWTVIKEMMVFIRNMESDVKSFSEIGHNDLKDFHQLAENLQKNINLLTSNCTMSGEAHDELHKWLIPYMQVVSELGESENLENAQQIVSTIETSFKVFNTYFE